MRILKQSHSAEKLGRGEPLATKKFDKKHSAEKNSNDHIVSSGFVSTVKNGVNEKGILCTNLDAFPLASPVV